LGIEVKGILHLNEFDFRYNSRKVSDEEHTAFALEATDGLREPEVTARVDD